MGEGELLGRLRRALPPCGSRPKGRPFRPTPQRCSGDARDSERYRRIWIRPASRLGESASN
ncbi:hypothetical protein ACWD4N_43470, partial [Streptomyces sp. NPDC002586]